MERKYRYSGGSYAQKYAAKIKGLPQQQMSDNIVSGSSPVIAPTASHSEGNSAVPRPLCQKPTSSQLSKPVKLLMSPRLAGSKIPVMRHNRTMDKMDVECLYRNQAFPSPIDIDQAVVSEETLIIDNIDGHGDVNDTHTHQHHNTMYNAKESESEPKIIRNGDEKFTPKIPSISTPSIMKEKEIVIPRHVETSETTQIPMCYDEEESSSSLNNLSATLLEHPEDSKKSFPLFLSPSPQRSTMNLTMDETCFDQDPVTEDNAIFNNYFSNDADAPAEEFEVTEEFYFNVNGNERIGEYYLNGSDEDMTNSYPNEAQEQYADKEDFEEEEQNIFQWKTPSTALIMGERSVHSKYNLNQEQQKHTQSIPTKRPTMNETQGASSISGVKVPDTIILHKTGELYSGILTIYNPSNVFYAYKITCNRLAKGKYSATPNTLCIPPNSYFEVNISTQEIWYSDYLSKGDFFIVHGLGTPRYLDNKELKTYLKAMRHSHPEIGLKHKVKPILVDPSMSSCASRTSNPLNSYISPTNLAKEVSIWTQTVAETNLELRTALKIAQRNIRLAFLAAICTVGLVGIWLLYPLMEIQGDETPLLDIIHPPVSTTASVSQENWMIPSILCLMWESVMGKV